MGEAVEVKIRVNLIAISLVIVFSVVFLVIGIGAGLDWRDVARFASLPLDTWCLWVGMKVYLAVPRRALSEHGESAPVNSGDSGE